MREELEVWVKRAEAEISIAPTAFDLANRELCWTYFFRGITVAAPSDPGLIKDLLAVGDRLDAAAASRRPLVGRLS